MSTDKRPTDQELEYAKKVHNDPSSTVNDLWDAHSTMIQGARHGTEENPK